ncbi:E1 [Bettongia penicillata papillomavirus 1]|uniref:Replication protein E1 n=1 Tax=Bettongia penicillata papillomavirus 1 TaxID=759701 RepID=D6N1C0_9PAPI|nr:E1 [Bettongia penicillata papillomavirus 1]ADG21986.1 E1 [Bettongia penicillata papillomavirus 1]
MDNKGTSSASEFILEEAFCSDTSMEEDVNSDSSISNLIDDTEQEEQVGISRELYMQQQREESAAHLNALKRKYFRESQNTHTHSTPKKKATGSIEDSGVGCSYEINNFSGAQQVPGGEDSTDGVLCVNRNVGNMAPNDVRDLLQCKNARVSMFVKFKEAFEISFADLTRTFKSNKTCCAEWVVGTFGVSPDVVDVGKVLLEKHCEYLQICYRPTNIGYIVLGLFTFKNVKCRETVLKLFSTTYNVDSKYIMCEPPKTRSVPAAVYWFNNGTRQGVAKAGNTPEWILTQTLLTHQSGKEQFDLSKMVQWAYDNELADEADIAYNYAKYAETDTNAAAWLNTNSQAKHVKDCSVMVRHYRRAEMKSMSFSQWVHRRIQEHENIGSWKDIVKFLRYQNIAPPHFISTLKLLFKGTPKKNCLVVYGPPDTGKTQFCMSLMKFMRGRVLSFCNSKSHFWLQPLTECKIALIDDATYPCWQYIDTYLRNGLDGNPVTLDCKHKAPVQTKFPPLLITTNLDIAGDAKWKYLHSRIKQFNFENEFPLTDNGLPLFDLSASNWASFLQQMWRPLDLSDQEEDEDKENGDPDSSFRCCARKINGSF